MAAAALAADAGATEGARAAAAEALALTEQPQQPERLLDLRGLRAHGERAAAYEDSRKAVQQAALDELALRDRELLQELLRRFAESYAAAKDRESALDFEDLQLRARDLLRGDPALRAEEQLRFRVLMVDEFQDTNRLQCELVDLLTAPDTERFFVGDEFQSIYGFRHADVQVFRERRREAETLLPLTRNYRSRPEVLRVVNHLFAAEFGDEFQPLAASGEFPDPVFGIPVELLVTDKSAYANGGVHWRRAEAQHVARRVRELVDAGAAAPGEIVLLFAAGTDAEWYEEELRALGLPTYRATGRGYFGQQQVVDLLSYLRLLHNRYDDDALVSVLASPFVGVSNDALLLIRRAAARRPIFAGIERGLPPDLTEADERLLRAFRQRYDRLVEASARLSLERLCERTVADHDYDLAVLAHPDGRRRYANLRKLARLARSYEELRGPDVEGFVRFVNEQDAVGTVERDAVAEEEGADAVRLLTIHGAKGLEFKVVVVADAGRDRAAPSADEILCLSDGRFGFRVADPVTGKRHGAFEYADVTEARRREEEAERLRLYYVAMTRAIDRLIVSGSIDLAPARPAIDEKTPIGWVLGRLDCADELAGTNAGPVELEREGARVLLRLDRGAPEVPAALEEIPVEIGQLALFDQAEMPVLPPLAPSLAPIPPLPEAPLHDVRRLSYSALALFDRCSYRYYAERVAGMRPADARGTVPGATGTGGDRDRRCGAPPARARRPGRPAAAGSRAGARLVSGGDRRRARPHPRLRGGLLRVGARPSRRRAPRCPAGATVRIRARRRPAPRPPRRPASRRAARARPRLQDELARGGHARRDRGRGLPAAAARLRVGVLPCRRGRGRGRLPLPGAGRRGRLADLRPRRAAPAGGGALGRDRTDPRRRVPADAERVRMRRVPRARPRVRRAAAARIRSCMKRVAVLSDVHGNLPALDAVLAEVDADAVVCCGDVALGASPAESLARMRDAGAQFVRGNCDRDPGDWVREQLSAEETDFLAALPLTVELDVDGLGRVLFCHGTPRSDEEIFTRLTPDDELSGILEGVEADVVVCGHTHVQFDRRVGDVRVVNAGSVGLPYEGKPGAFWLVLGPEVDFRATSYDMASAADAMERAGHASAAQFADFLREHRDPDETSRYFESLRDSS